MEQIETFLRDFIRPLRMAELDAGAPQSGISPSETTCWVLDILRIEGTEAFVQADRDTLMVWLIQYSGAIAKDGEEAEKLTALLRELETREQQAHKEAQRKRRERLSQARLSLQERIDELHVVFENSDAYQAGDMAEHARIVQEKVAEFKRFIDNELLPGMATDFDVPTYSRKTEFPDMTLSEPSKNFLIGYYTELKEAIAIFAKTELQPGGTLDQSQPLTPS